MLNILRTSYGHLADTFNTFYNISLWGQRVMAGRVAAKDELSPEALYIVGSCHERDSDNKKIFMSSPARAEGYDTPAQQR